MGSLQEAYRKNRIESNEKMIQEFIKGFDEHFMILEKLDRATIDRLSKSISAIEAGIGQFATKLPSLSAAIKSATDNLAKIQNGGGNPKEALANMVQLYSGLSEFFREDIPVLLKSPVFKTSIESFPDEPISQSQEAGKLVSAIQNALKPNDKGLLSRLASYMTGGRLKTILPYLNIPKFAQELSALTPNELSQLSKEAGQRILPPASNADIKRAEAELKASTPTAPPGEAPAATPDAAPQAAATPAEQPAAAPTAPRVPNPETITRAKQAIKAALRDDMGDNIPDALLTKILRAVGTAVKKPQ